ncbi:hypothetical protein F511_23886 [Dorcoceras hygrometricum]|uniref:Uncharacterized protein n=1 Tax=Dorcoceras hygrometricum TaxID=472368 RepID=A0A2Z7C001_9LAMI|nr:hypothetical protein F511_23886 [Dorcoceras hygrometricum]
MMDISDSFRREALILYQGLLQQLYLPQQKQSEQVCSYWKLEGQNYPPPFVPKTRESQLSELFPQRHAHQEKTWLDDILDTARVPSSQEPEKFYPKEKNSPRALKRDHLPRSNQGSTCCESVTPIDAENETRPATVND